MPIHRRAGTYLIYCDTFERQGTPRRVFTVDSVSTPRYECMCCGEDVTDIVTGAVHSV